MTDYTDPRLSSPAVFRNRGPILDILREVLPAQGIILEVASGSGEHITYLAERLPALEWQPSDPSPAARASIAAWTAAEGLTNVRPPLDLDASALPWPVSAADAILAINMVHISPWAATQGLLREAARLLPLGGLLYLYGPFIEAGKALAPSNAAFDADLRDRNVAWGLRDLATVQAEAAKSGMKIEAVLPMPANNLSVIVRRT
jgi:SAM-dependent methyltransferase